MLPPVKGFVKNTLIDWEGKIAAVLFLPECNFRCHYCHASHLVLEPSQLETIPFEMIAEFLKNSKGWIDGVVISGGEPTLWEGLQEMLIQLRKSGMQTKLDTNGSRPEVLEHLLRKELVDCIAMDLKAPLDERYSEVAGVEVNLNNISASVDLLLKDHCDYEFRTTVCPQLTGRDEIADIARRIKGAKRYILQSFRPLNCIAPAFKNLEPYPLETMLELAEAAKPWVIECFVRGQKKMPLSV